MPPLVLGSFIRLLTCLIGNPPKEACLQRVWQHVLVPKVNLLKYISRTRNDSTFSILDSQDFADTSPESEFHLKVGGAWSAPPSYPLRPLSSCMPLPLTVLSPECLSPTQGNDTDVSDLDGREEEGEEEDATLHLLRPQTTNPLTFEQITGLAKMTEDEEDWESGAGESSDVGGLGVALLGEIRRQLVTLPDSSVSNVVGPIVSYESLLAIANHDSILVRTAAVRVRGGEGEG